ncbi:glycosyltransferase [Oleidesulfovibrio alaskensis]|jgi:GT2 family glycosyltransferase|uniref:glycosyltransferase n=1 Tax=Oleidesulfovibrio alaskensis TaxID=58180 RepID=UPI001A3A1329|nr:glycosyltransferase [Oleidesulfovibrio alaskensis]MBL3582833.1 glycosyltransferase [Oleidesulfovibrio alaskensis]
MTSAHSAAMWMRYPAFLRERLLHGSAGSLHLLQAASDMLSALETAPVADRMFWWHTGRELLLAAWEDDCLNIRLGGQLLELDGHARRQEGRPWLSGALRSALQALQQSGAVPENLRYYQRLAAQGDYGRCMRYLDGERAKHGDNIWWVQQVCAVGELTGNAEWSLEHVRRYAATAPQALQPVLAYAGAGLWLCAGRADTAEAVLEQLHVQAGEVTAAGMLCGVAARLGHIRQLQGHSHEALRLWQDVLRARPFHVSLALRAHAVRGGLHVPACSTGLGRVAALLYSYNKAADLDDALGHLAHSAQQLHTIVALDNGSTDGAQGTGAVIDAWADRLGDRMHAVHLPVNIGAPAARNWLMHLPQVAECDFAAYLDDDAALPADWLGHMARAVQVRPAASVWGGKIVDAAAPYIVQSADLHLTMAGSADDTPEQRSALAGESLVSVRACPFNVSDVHAQVTDWGQFDYIRPCISVTGCCHLFRTADLLDSGDFSLMFSPTQYDDLEHDLRMATQGRHACYTGFLTVRHMKRTGKAVRMSAAQYGNGAGNKYKLHNMYPPESIIRLRRAELDMLERHLLETLADAG